MIRAQAFARRCTTESMDKAFRRGGKWNAILHVLTPSLADPIT